MKNYCRPNRVLLNEINKRGYSLVGNYSFYLLLTTVNDFGYIPNFSNQIKILGDQYKFSRNTGKNQIESLIKLGWVSYNSNKDILYIKSQDKILKELNIGKSLKQIDVSLISVSFQKLKYILNSLTIQLTQKNKFHIIQEQIKKSGQYKIEHGTAKNIICSNNKYNWVNGCSRSEIAHAIGSEWNSTGAKKIKRLKQFGLICSDFKRDSILVKENCSPSEFILMKKYKSDKGYIYFKNNSVFKKQSNIINFKFIGIKCYEKK